MAFRRLALQESRTQIQLDSVYPVWLALDSAISEANETSFELEFWASKQNSVLLSLKHENTEIFTKPGRYIFTIDCKLAGFDLATSSSGTIGDMKMPDVAHFRRNSY